MDFLNTRWYLTHKINKEILADYVLLTEFLKSRHLPVGAPPSAESIQDLLALRTFLAATLTGYMQERAISAAGISRINYYLALSTCRRVMEQGRHGFNLTIQPVACDWNWVMAEITASFVDLIECGDHSRIKLCENPDCEWFFYDETKSRTKRWCDDKCASLMKVRKFRAKHKKKTFV
ncbi:CGNR zinc finger domain-containing protein [Sporomusa termitida]|uniref:CGNR zinc finger domain-containing protein n=1 Tax=Sporomusa termitida TaxID=2377 RepID=UPI001FE71095|nr:CGNR zinc finger domain-containing protein [Sporomusa termitida]